MKSVRFFLLLIVFVLSSCHFFDELSDLMNRSFQCVTIKNNSTRKIAFYPYSFLPISGIYGAFYPDTLLPPEDIGFYSARICPMEEYTYRTIFETKNIRSYFGGRDSLMFFVFSVDTLDKYSWDEIYEGYMVLKRYDLSITDLDSLNWTITYP